MADAPNGGTAISEGSVAEHYLGNYAGRLRLNMLAQGPSPGEAEALELFDRITAQVPDTQAIPGSLPLVVPGPDGVDVSIPSPDDPPTFFAGVQDMAQPQAVSGGAKMQLTFIFNAERRGWSETLHAVVTGDDPYFKLYQPAREYVVERKKFLYKDCKLEAVRISRMGVRGDAILKRNNADWNLGKGALPGSFTPADIQTCWQFRLEDDLSLVHANPVYRGLVTVDAPVIQQGSPDPESIPTRIDTWAQFLRKLYRNKDELGNPIYDGVTFCMATYGEDREDGAGSKVVNFRTDSDGLLQFDFDDVGSAPALSVGDLIKLRVPKIQGVTGISGEVTVSKITTVSSTRTLTVRKRICVAVSMLAGVVGRVQTKTPILTPVSIVNPVAIGDRDTGSAFFRRRGRRKGRSC